MPRLLLVLILTVFFAGGAWAQGTDNDPAAISDADQALIDRIEAQLQLDGIDSIEDATDQQIADAAAELVTADMTEAELNALLRAAILARPGAGQAILTAMAARAADLGFGATVIASMIVTTMDTLTALGITFDPDVLIAAVAAATGISVDVLQDAVDDIEELEEEEEIEEENPNQDASPT